MKIIVETTNNGMLMGLGPESEVQSHRPSVVRPSYLIEIKASKGEVRVLGQVNDKATDVEFNSCWKESKGDKALAVDSFLAMFPVEGEAEAEAEVVEPVETPEPAPAPAKKKAGNKSAEA